MSVDFQFYFDTFKGSRITSEEEFERLLVRATMQLNKYERMWTVTFHPFPDRPDDFMRNMALCSLCDEIQLTNIANDSTGENGIVRSVSFSSASTTFDGVTAADAIATAGKRYENAVSIYAHIYKGAKRLCR